MAGLEDKRSRISDVEDANIARLIRLFCTSGEDSGRRTKFEVEATTFSQCLMDINR